VSRSITLWREWVPTDRLMYALHPSSPPAVSALWLET
jgi:hypothetical protein